MELFFLLLAMIFLTFCSGYFSGAEAALFSLPAVKIKSFQRDPDVRNRLIANLLLQPRNLLVTIFMLNTLVNILLQNVVSSAVGENAGWVIKVGVPLVLTLIFGELIPKYIGLQNNTRIAHSVIPMIYFLQNLLKPIRDLIIAVTTPVSRILFFYLKKEQSISQEEMEHVLKTSQEHGVVDPEESELICGYLQLQDSSIKEIMRPKEDILYYDIKEPISKLTYLFVEQECSRVPVCDEHIDNMLGIITAKQFFLHRNTLKTPQDLLLSQLLTKPFYVPESTSARLMLKRFDERRQQLALTVDEYGSISGLISKEDLVEVVIGEITDLRDQESLYTARGKNEILASGRLDLTTFNELFDVEFFSPNNVVTIGGWLIEKIGDIPKTGSKYELDGFLFQVLAATPNRIRRLYIRKMTSIKPHNQKSRPSNGK